MNMSSVNSDSMTTSNSSSTEEEASAATTITSLDSPMTTDSSAATPTPPPSAPAPLPPPMSDPKRLIEHVVVLQLENRSFDHMYGELYRQDVRGDWHDLSGAVVQLHHRGRVVVGGEREFEGYPVVRHEVDEAEKRVQAPLAEAAFVDAAFWPLWKPHEEHEHVTRQFFNVPEYEQIDWNHPPPQAPEYGFVLDHMECFKDLGRDDLSAQNSVLRGLNLRLLPALARLATEYGVSDDWHCSVPTQTWANRLFAFAGNSSGVVNNKDCDDGNGGMAFRDTLRYLEQSNGGVRSLMTHMDAFLTNGDAPPVRAGKWPDVAESGWSWCVYTHQKGMDMFSIIFGGALAQAERHVEDENDRTYRTMEQFARDAVGGTLPAFSVLEPAYCPRIGKDGNVIPHNDHHPTPMMKALDALFSAPSVWEADKLVLSAYKSLFVDAKPEKAEKTLFVVLYDEHGGIFDHVPLPVVSPPHPIDRQVPAFQFQRAGARVPAVFISPHIAPHTVLRAPRGTGDNEVFDHTSIIRSVRERWTRANGKLVPPLSLRDEAAPHFWPVLDPLAAAACDRATPAQIASDIEREHYALDERLAKAHQRKPLGASILTPASVHAITTDLAWEFGIVKAARRTAVQAMQAVGTHLVPWASTPHQKVPNFSQKDEEAKVYESVFGKKYKKKHPRPHRPHRRHHNKEGAVSTSDPAPQG